jgi:hypothetical protein
MWEFQLEQSPYCSFAFSFAVAPLATNGDNIIGVGPISPRPGEGVGRFMKMALMWALA